MGDWGTMVEMTMAVMKGRNKNKYGLENSSLLMILAMNMKVHGQIALQITIKWQWTTWACELMHLQEYIFRIHPVSVSSGCRKVVKGCFKS